MDSGNNLRKGTFFSNSTASYRGPNPAQAPSRDSENSSGIYEQSADQSKIPKYRPSLFSHVVTSATTHGSQSHSEQPHSDLLRKSVNAYSNNKSTDTYNPTYPYKQNTSSGSHIILDHPSSQNYRKDYNSNNHQANAVSVRAKPAAPILYVGKGARIARPQAPQEPESTKGYARPQNNANGIGGMALNSLNASKFFQSAGLKVKKTTGASNSGAPLAIMPPAPLSPELDDGSPNFFKRKSSNVYNKFEQNNNRSFSQGTMARSRSPSSSYKPRASYPMTNSRSTSSSGGQLIMATRGNGPRISPMVSRIQNEYHNEDNDATGDFEDEDYPDDNNSFDEEYSKVADEYDRELEEELENEKYNQENDFYDHGGESDDGYNIEDDEDFDKFETGFERDNRKSPILLKIPNGPVGVMPPGSKLSVSSDYMDSHAKSHDPEGQHGDTNPSDTGNFDQLQIKQARSDRKIMDLEISNASLMKVNKYLEKKIRNQAKNAQKESLLQKRKSMFSKMVPGLKDNQLHEESEEEKDKVKGEEKDSEGMSSLDSNSDSEDGLDDSDNDSNEDFDMKFKASIFDDGDLTQEEAELAEKTRLVEERMQSHIKYLEWSEKVNKQIRDCLFISDALLEQAQESLAYEVDVKEMKIEEEESSNLAVLGEIHNEEDEEEDSEEERFEGLGTTAKFGGFKKLTEQEEEDAGIATDEEIDEEDDVSEQSFEYKHRTQEYASFLPLEVMEEIERELDEMMIEDEDNGNKTSQPNESKLFDIIEE